MLKLIIDITLLGHGFHDSRFRTGLYRFTDELLKSLIADNQLDIYFIASQLNHQDCQKYLKSKYPQLLPKFILPKTTSKSNILAKILHQSLCAIRKLCKIFNIKILLLDRVNRHFGFFLDLLKIKHNNIDAKQLELFDIYFSPYNALPRQIQRSKIKKVIYIHDIIPILFPQYFEFRVKYYFKKLINSFSSQDLVICNSINTKTDLLAYRRDLIAEAVKVIYPGINDGFVNIQDAQRQLEINHKYGIPKNIKYIFTLSSLNPRKNFKHVIESFILFIEKYQIEDLYIVIGGPKGWKYEDLFAGVKFAHQKNRIIFTGFIDEPDLSLIYSNALFFTLMSLYEGFGFPILEAMKCGSPVITSNNSSLIEVAKDVAICIDPTNSQDLVTAFHDLYNSSEMRDSLIAKGYQQSAKFSWKECAAEIIKELKNA